VPTKSDSFRTSFYLFQIKTADPRYDEPTAYFRFSYTTIDMSSQLFNGKTKLFQFDYMDIKVINLNLDESFSCKFDTETLLDITCLMIVLI
ncbi:hypothetical protein BpHYR1_009993, partial [Brachionus plicatilis]